MKYVYFTAMSISTAVSFAISMVFFYKGIASVSLCGMGLTTCLFLASQLMWNNWNEIFEEDKK